MGVLQNVIRELGKEVCRFTGGEIQDQIPRVGYRFNRFWGQVGRGIKILFLYL